MIINSCESIKRPVLERIATDELKSVSDDTYNKLYRNQNRLMLWGDTLNKKLNLMCGKNGNKN